MSVPAGTGVPTAFAIRSDRNRIALQSEALEEEKEKEKSDEGRRETTEASR